MSNTPYTPEEIRQKLLDAAKELFLAHGIAGTEMKMVAQHSGLSRSTLYRYTTDKDQLVFMVSIAIITEFTERSLAIASVPGDTGFVKLQKFSQKMVDILAGEPSISRFFSEFDRIFTGDYPDIPEAQEYARLTSRLLSRDAQFLFEGMSDGSIRQLEDPMLFLSTLLNTILGLAERLLPRDAHYQREHQATSRAIINHALHILLGSIKAQ